MNKKFTKLIAAIALLVFMMPSMAGWGQATTYTTGSDITWTHSNGVIINSTTYPACKIAKGSNTTITIPGGTTTLYVHCAAWNGESANLTISTTTTGVSISPTSWSLTADSGISGNSTNFTLSNQNNASTSYFKAFTLSGVPSSGATIKFQTASNKRAVLWGINAETGGGSTPTIAFTGTTTYNATYTGTNYQTFTGTYSGLGDSPTFGVAFYSTAEATTQLTGDAIPDWLYVQAYKSNNALAGNFSVNLNEGGERHAYFKVYSGETYSSNVYTVNQAAAPTPNITITGTGIDNNAVSLAYNDTESHAATVTYNNMSNPASGDVMVSLYDDDACTTSFTGGWFSASFATNSVTSINYATSANNTTTTPRTVYMRVETFNSAGTDWVPCDVIAITQAGVPTYTVTYDNNGGSGTMTDSNNPYLAGATVTVLANTFTKEHYTFDKWNTQSDGLGTSYTAGNTFSINANTTLYAQWTGNTHTVTLPAEDTYGEYTMNKTNPVAYGTEVTLTYTPANGYEAYVATWSVNGNAISGNKFSMPDENVTVTVAVTEAHGTQANPYTVAEARAAIDAGTGTSNVYTRGIVSSSNGLSSSTITYFISDDGTSTNTLQVYKGKGLNNSNFTNGYDVQPGDVVVVYGTISYYSTASVYQYNNGNYLTYIKPVIALNATSVDNLESFSYIGNGPSEAQNFKVRGRNLTENLVLTVSEDYELCETSDGTYASSLSLTTTNSTEKTIYVRMKANLGAGTHNGTVTMTSADAVTKTVELTGSVSYSITYPASYTNGGVATAPNTAAAGATVTIVTAPADYYHPTEIVFSTTTPEDVTISGNNISFTMPAGNVVISSITFTQYQNVTVTYSVNGNTTTVAAATVETGQSTTLPTSIADLTVNSVTYTFEGWTADESEITSSSILTGSYTPTGDVTLYAVYSKTTTGLTEKVVILDGAQFPDSQTNSDATITSDGITYHYINAKKTDVYSTAINYFKTGSAILIGKSGKYIYNSTAFGEGITKFEVYANKGASTAVSVGINFSTSSISAYNADASNTWKQTLNPNDKVYNASTALPTGAKYFWFQVTNSNNSQVQFRITYNDNESIKEYYTLIKDINGAETMANVYNSHILTVKSGGVLTVTGNESNCLPENLIIEDGGQLITDDVIEATIKKNIKAYNPALVGQGISNGWYFISSPLNGEVDPIDVKNMIATTAEDYDLYKLVGNTWANYKEDAGGNNQDPLFSLYTGHGYLYANAASVTLEFAGSLNYRDLENDFVSLDNTGWNLVGNPFAYNTYPSMSYYKMNEAGTGIDATEYTTADAVPPCTGILVYDDEDDPQGLITFSKTAPASGGAKGGINLTLAETQRGAAKLDNAIVSFNEGSQLGKFYFGTQNANLYIPQGTEEYAIVSTEAQGIMPVNFRANENGTYTLTVNPENVEMNYLHLIDNMTGMNIDLLQTPSYSFEAKTTDYESRFRLVFASNDASTGSASDESFAFFSDGNLIVNNEGQATLQVIDITGRILSSETVNGSVSKTINATPGVYMLRLVNGDNVKVQKVVVR